MSAENRILRITIDEAMVIARSPEAEHERAVAMADLIEDNRFTLKSGLFGPYWLHVSAADQRLLFDIQPEDEGAGIRLPISLSALRSVIRDYFMMCDSYYDAIRHASPARIEAIDMGRRSVHNEGSLLVLEQLEPHVATDLETARRFFTFVCVLRLK